MANLDGKTNDVTEDNTDNTENTDQAPVFKDDKGNLLKGKALEKAQAEHKNKEARAKRREELKAHKDLLRSSYDKDWFIALEDEVKSAIKELVGTGRSRGTGGNTLQEQLEEMFPNVGDVKTELEVFINTKWGTAEMRKRINHCIKKCTDDKGVVNDKALWVAWDSANDSWVLKAIGGKMPEGYTVG